METLSQLARSGLGFLLSALKDSNPSVKNTTAWTIGVKPCTDRAHHAESSESVYCLLLKLCIARDEFCGCSPLTLQQCSMQPTGRIFEYVHSEDLNPPLIDGQVLPQIIQVLLEAIKDAPHIAEKVDICANALLPSESIIEHIRQP